MTPFDQLITVVEGTPQDSVKKLMHENRIEKVLVIDKSGALSGLVTMKDIEKSAEHPDATKDDSGRLVACPCSDIICYKFSSFYCSFMWNNDWVPCSFCHKLSLTASFH